MDNDQSTTDEQQNDAPENEDDVELLRDMPDDELEQLEEDMSDADEEQ